MSNSKTSRPVSTEELAQVKNILERMQSQGLSPGNSAMDALAALSQPVLQGMSDASKRLREESPSRKSCPEAEISESEFDVLSSPGASVAQERQVPHLPKKESADSEIKLPSGIKDVTQWGKTLCELQRVKAENKTYVEIAEDSAWASYVTWIVQHGKGKGARCEDFRNFLIYAKYAQGRDHNLTFPGSNEVRRFRDV